MKLSLWLAKTQQWLKSLSTVRSFAARKRRLILRTGSHVAEVMEQRLLLTGSGTNDPGEFFYSLTSSADLYNSDHSKIFADDSDIVKLTIEEDGAWRHDIFFDGSDVGLSHWEEDIDAFAIRQDGSILISTLGHSYLPGNLQAGAGDLLLFQPTTTGRHTSGEWSLYFDGSDVGLSDSENIDAVAELQDGSLVISTRRNATLPGIGQLRDEDLAQIQLSSTGNKTEGTWSRYFDGSDVGLNSHHENIDGLSFAANGETVYLSTTGTASASGLSASDEDIFAFEPTQLGSHTSGSFAGRLPLNASRAGISSWADIDAFHATIGDSTNPQPPVIDAIDDQSINEQQTLTVAASATDPDTQTDRLKWSLLAGPSAASIDEDTGQFRWTPTETDGPGTFQVTLSVTDGQLTDTETFAVVVNEVNRAPVLTAIDDQVVTAGGTVSFDANATDADLPANSLTYSISGDVPAGSIFDNSTGEFTWATSAAADAESYAITVTVSDGQLTDSDSFSITVHREGGGGGGIQVNPIGDQNVNELAAFQYQVVATGAAAGPSDIDFESAGDLALNAGDVITDQFAAMGIHVTTNDPHRHPAMIFDSSRPTGRDFDLGTPNRKFGGPGIGSGGKSGAWRNDVARDNILIISEDADSSDPDDNARGGTLIFTFDSPTDIDDIRLLDVDSGRNTVRLYDAAGQQISSTNIPRRGNNSVQLHALDAVGVSRMEVQFAGSGAITDLIFDRDGDGPTGGPLTYALAAGSPEGMTISNTGLILWTPTEAQGPGTYNVSVLVSDGVSTVTETFQIAVAEVNVAPTVTPIADQAVDELSDFTYQVVATDSDLPANTLTYSLAAGAPTGMVIDSSGLITWTPTEAQGIGSYPVTVLVSDGTATSSTGFEVDVREVNVAPLINAISDVQIDELQLFELQVVATDSDLPTNTLTYSLAAGAPTGMVIDSSGLITWTPTEAQGIGSYPVTVLVSDGTATSSTGFEVDVREVNVAPLINAISDVQIDELQLFELQVVATDSDLPANTLAYSLAAGAPTGMTISIDGLIQWTPTEQQGPSQNVITVNVSDGTATSSQSFELTVVEVNLPPVLSPVESQVIDEESPFELQFTASDADSPVNDLTYGIVGTPPAGLTVDTAGLLKWTPSEGQGPATFDITIEVSDGQLTDSQTFTISVNEINEAPKIQAIADQQHPELTSFTYQVEATDSDLPAASLSYELTSVVPAGMSIDANGLISWAPTEAQGPGNYDVSVQVSDGQLTDVETFQISVTEQNLLPVLAEIGNQTAFPSSSVTFQATATDDDLPANTLTYSLSGDVPAGATIDSVTGAFNWDVPSNASLGARVVTITVDDQNGGQDTETISITVEGPAISTITLTEDDRFETTASQTITVPAEPAYLVFDILNLSFDTDAEGKISDAFEVALLDADGNSLVHTIAAGRDSFFNSFEPGNQTAATNTVVDGSVVRVDLSHLPAGTTATVVYRLVNNDNSEGNDTATTVTVTEPAIILGDLNTPTGSSVAPNSDVASGPIDLANLIDVTSSLTFSYRQTSYNDGSDTLFADLLITNNSSQPIDGPFVLVVQNLTNPLVAVSEFDGVTEDGDRYYLIVDQSATGTIEPGATTLAQTLRFLNPNDSAFDYNLTVLASPNAAPAFNSVPVTLVEAGRPYSYDSNAEEPDGDTLTYELLAGPAGMTIDSATGQITWSPETADIGNQSVVIKASDGRGAFDEQQFTVEIRDVVPNRPPVILSSPVIQAFVSTDSSQEIGNLVVNGDFEDGDTGFASEYGNAGIGIGAAQYSITTDPNSEFFLATSYGDFSTGSGRMMAVNGSTTPGDIVWEQTVAVVPGRTYDFAAAISSWFPAAPAALLFTVNGEDIGALNAPAEPGEWEQIFATWDAGDSVSATIRIVNANTVFSGNDFALDGIYFGGPRFSNPSYQYDVNAVDADADPITYSLNQAPDGMSIDAATGLIGWNPNADQLGTHTVVVLADDGRGGTATQEYQVVVLSDEGNSAPVIVSDPIDEFFIPGFSNPATGEVTPQRISLDLGNGETFDGTVSITLPDQAGRFADIVVAVDESSSMGGEQDWVAEMLPLLDNALKAEGIGADSENPNRFAIVGFGGGSGIRANITAGHFLNQQQPTKYTLYGPDGEVATTGRYDDFVPDDLLNLQLPDSGRYVLVVEASDPTDLADGIDIGIEAQLGDAVRRESLVIGEIVDDRLSQPGQPVEYDFTLTTPKFLYFDSLEKDVRVRWSLRGPQGLIEESVPFSQSDTSLTDPILNLPAGDYTLILNSLVSNPYHQNVNADYRFQLLDLADATPIRSGDTIGGEFLERNETFAYRFDATAGQQFEFANSITAFHFGGQWRLVAPNGTILPLPDGATSRALGVNQPAFALPVTGQYYLLYEAAHASTEGSGTVRDSMRFDFTVNVSDAQPPSPLTIGETVNGTIDFVGDVDAYSFNLSSRTSLAFDSLVDSQMTWTLTGPAGTTTAKQLRTSDSLDSTNSVLNLVTGDYVLRINSNGVEGAYALRLLDLAAGTEVIPGTQFDGQLNVPSQTDVYRFDAVAGDQFYIDIVSASDVSRTDYKIHDQFGRQIYNSANLQDFAPLSIPSNGTYSLLVEGRYFNVDADTYSINIVPITTTTQALTLGRVTNGTRPTPGAEFVYTFSLTEDTQLYFDALTNNTNLRWTLEGPRGVEVGSTNFNQSDSIDRADVSIDALQGDYSLTISAVGDMVGDFSFALLDLQDPAQSTPLAQNPSSTNPSVSITPTNGLSPNQTDIFRFVANPGDELSFVTTVVGSNNSWYRLLDQNGTAVVPTTRLSTDQPNETLTLGGTYYLLIEGRFNSTEVDDWSMDVNFIQNNGPTVFDGTPLTLGATTSGDLNTASQVDTYTFTLTERSVLYFDSLTNNSSIHWNLTGPTGVAVSGRSFTRSDSLNLGDVTAEYVSGDYRLDVYATSGIAGSYSFRLHDVADATQITPGVSFSNTLDPANETHLYKFDATAGERFYFDIESASDTSNTLYKLIDPYGDRIVTVSNLSDFGPHTIELDGTYTLLLEGWRGNTGVDTYTMNVHRLPDSVATPLVFGAVNSGSFAVPGNDDVFTFSLTDYAQVHFDALTDSRIYNWTLSNSLGTIVDGRRFSQSDSINGTVNVIELTPDDYTLTIAGVGETLDYSFRLLDLAENSTAIATDTQISSVHADTRSTNIFELDLQAGDQAFFNHVSRSGFSRTGRWRLFDATANEVFDTSFATDVGPITIENTGKHRLVIEGDYRNTLSNGEFVFEVLSLENEFNLAAPTPLSVGDLVDTDISKQHETDRYSFSLSEDGLIYFDSLTNDSSLTWTLENDVGVIVDARRFNGSDSVNNSSPVLSLQAGDYVLSVTSPEVEPYSFRLQNLVEAQLISTNSPQTGEFTSPNETDVFQFAGTEGQQIYLDVISDIPASTAYMRLVDEFGGVISTQTTMTDQDVIVLPRTGPYYLLLESRVSTTVSSTYEISVVSASTRTEALTIGDTITGEIIGIGESVEYSFTLDEPTSLYFDALTDTAEINWTLEGVGGSVVQNRQFDASDARNNADPVLKLLPAGDYTLTVDAAVDSVGTFSFRLLDIEADSTAVTLGTSFNDVFTVPNQTNIYQFDGSQGDRLLVDFLAASDINQATYRIYDPLLNKTFELNSLVDGEINNLDGNRLLTLPGTGTYTLLVEAWHENPDSDTYEINLANNGTRTVAINVGDLIDDAIASPGEQVEFNFNVGSDTFIYLDSLTNDDSLNWSLTGPTGELVSERRFDRTNTSTAASVVFEAREGNYKLTVDAVLDHVNPFRFQVVDLASVGTSATTNFAGELNPGNATDIYRFHVDAGDRYTLNAVSVGNINATYRIVNPFGVEVHKERIDQPEDLEFNVSGSHFLLVEGTAAPTVPNAYELSLVFDGNTPPAAFTGSALTLGSVQEGDLNTADQVDSYQFTLTERSLLHMDVLTNSSAFRWSLKGPRGSEIVNQSFTNTDSLDSATSNYDLIAGDYQLDIFASSGTPGVYGFTLHDFADAIPVTLGTPFTGELTNPVSGLTNPVETDLYQFTATANDRLLIDVVSTNDASGKEYKLIDEYGIVVVDSSNSLVDRDNVVIPRDGVYTLLVEGRRNSSGSADTYELNIVPIISTTLTLTPGTTNSTGLSIGNELAYTFRIDDPSLVVFTPQTDSNLVQWTLASVAGEFVSSRDFDDGVLSVDLPVGNYTLLVDGVTDYAADAEFTVLIADSANVLNSGTIANTTLTNSAATTVYQFNGTAGQHFSLLPDLNLQFADAATAAVTAANFQSSGDPEDGWSGIDVALRADVFRDGAAVNFIVATDEDRDNDDDNLSFEGLFADLSARDALLNMVVNRQFRDENNDRVLGVDSNGVAYKADGAGGFTVTGGGFSSNADVSTQQDYLNLAWALDGAAWDLGLLRGGGLNAESFTNAFVDIKVAEILEQTSLKLSASDPNADLTFVNPTTGQFDNIVGGQQYDFDIQIGNDGNPRSFDLLFTQGQTVGSIPVYIVAPYGYNAMAVDADGDTLTWSITEGPDGLVVDPATGILSWPADTVIYGLHSVTLRVADGRGGFDEQSFELNVNGGEAASISGLVREFTPIQQTIVNAFVPGSANPYLAGMPDGSTASGGDIAPDQSPVLVENLELFEGGVLSFAATGMVSRSGGTPNPMENPDGNLSGFGSHSAGAENGISQITSNYNSLVAVFLADGQPVPANVPSALDFINGADVPNGINNTMLRPDLQQVFFIGDGLNAAGNQQEFIVPEGATRLFLGTLDSENWSDNTGGFDVQITQTIGQAHVLDTLEYEGKTYQLVAGNSFGDGISWNDAQAYAESNGSSVAIVDSLELHNVLYDTWGRDSELSGLWIGLTDRFDEGNFVWESTGDLPVFTNWAPGEPNQFTGDNEDAVLIWSPGNSFGGALGKWNDVPRDATYDLDAQVYAIVEVGRRLTEPRTVYLDQNRNGIRDANEQFEITDTEGNYRFDNVGAGSYVVAQEPVAGWDQLSPASSYEIFVDGGDHLGNVDFLNQRVSIVNTDPRITSSPERVVVARETFQYTPTFEEFDGDDLTFDLPLAPAGMAINPANGRIIWDSTIEDIGPINVMLRVRDGRGGFDLQYFTIDVQKPNIAPIITSTAPVGPAGVGLPYQYNANAIDADDDTLTWSLTDAPTGATIDATTGLINWTPASGQLGPQDFVVAVEDGRGLSDQQTFSVTVEVSPINIDPQFLSTPPVEAYLANTYLYLVQATDTNGDPLTYRLDESPNGMTIDADGLVSWTPTPAQVGSSLVRIVVEDGRGGTATQEYSISVDTQPVNQAPQITSPPKTTAVAGEPYNFQPTATDANNDTLVWELVSGPIGMSINPSSGTLNWLPTTNDLGSEQVVIRVFDPSAAFSELGYTLNVRAVNTPPVIQTVPLTSAAVGATFLHQVQATDADGDQLSYSLATSPAGMVIDPASGLIQWTPVGGQEGSNAVNVRVSDGNGGFADQSFVIQTAAGISNLNPTITSAPSFFAGVGDLYSYDVEATDPEGATLTYELLQSPTSMTIDGSTGVIQWTPTAGDLGTTIVRLVARDPAGAGSLQEFSLTVLAANNAPVINSTPPTIIAAGATYRYDVLATDADGEFLTYELVNAPAGMLIDGVGRIFWIPTSMETGSNPVEVKVTDPRGGTVTQAFDINVEFDTVDPQVAVLLSQNPVNIGDSVDIRVSAIDNVGVESLTLTVDGVAVALDANGIARLPMNTVGGITAFATATDAAGNTVTDSITIFVTDPNDVEGPVVGITSPSDGGIITGLTDIVGTVTDDTLVEYRLLVAKFGTGDFQQIATGNVNVTNDVLGQLDPTLLANGSYILRLEAFDAGGRSNITQQFVEISGSNKLGNFRVSFTDLVVPVNGIDVVLNRTYDSLTSAEDSDFGFGWRMDFRDVQLQVSVDEASDFDKAYGFYTPYRIGTRVYITLPGGERQGFTFSPAIRQLPSIFGPGLVLATPRFIPDAGVTNRLTVQSGQLLLNEFGETTVSGGLPWNPASPDYGGGFTLTTKEGIAYRIDGNSGKVTRISDPNGNQLDFSDAGVTSNSGLSINFERDINDRIVGVIDPEGNRISYGYDAAGNLETVVDRLGNTTTYGYATSPSGYLESITDPLGRTGTRAQYGADGRLTATLDVDGNSTSYTYDPANSIAVRTDANGDSVIVEYDQRGNVVVLTDPLGAVIRMTYDQNDNLLSRTDELGNTTFLEYNAQGDVISSTDALGNTIRSTFNSMGMPLVSTDAAGNATQRTYDEFGNLSTTTDPRGATTSFGMDQFGNVNRVTDAEGATRTSTYDAAGNVLTQTDSLGNTFSYQYDSRGNLLREVSTVTGASGVETREWQYSYDANGNLLTTTDADGQVSKFVYDAAGNRVSSEDENGAITTVNFNDDNQVASVVRAAGSQSNFVYDPVGNLVEVSTGNNDKTWREYDEVGRLLAILFADDTPEDLTDNPRRTFEYDAAGNEIANTDELGNRTEFQYDPIGRLIASIDAAGAVYRRQYDAIGNMVIQTDPLGRLTQFSYDEVGNLTSVEYADGSTVSYVFDSLNRVVSTTDELGNSSNHRFDSEGRLLQVTDAIGGQTSYEYDEAGNLTSVTDAAGRTTTYEYDSLNRRTAIVSPLGYRSEVQYDAVSNPIRQVDADGRINQNFYDAEGRVTRREMWDSTVVTFSYDDQGQLVQMSDDTGTSTMTYDVRGRLLSRTNGDGISISYAYDAAGNRTQVATPGGTTDYTYDALSRLSTVVSTVGGTTSYAYDLVSNLTKTVFTDGTSETRSYDSRDRLVNLATVDATNAPLQSFSYSLLANGLIESVAESGAVNRTVQYEYDDLYRLKLESIAGSTSQDIGYVYDAVGNRTSKTDSISGQTNYSYDANDRLLSEVIGGTTTAYVYNQSGELVSKTSGSDSSTFTYDANGKLTAATVVEAGTTRESTYTYTADGLRVVAVVDGTETRYLVDSNRAYSEILDEYTLVDGVQKHYVVGHSITTVVDSASVHALHADAIGSVRFVTSNGTVTGTSTTDAFGNILLTTGNASEFPGFAGRSRDAVTGLLDMRARDYDSSTGRFRGSDVYPDTVGQPATWHRYTFAANNPVNFTDPTGYFTLAEQLTSTGLVTDLIKTYSKNLGKLFLTAVRISECVVRPGQQLRTMGARLVEQGVPRGEVMYAKGSAMIAAGLTELNTAIKQAYKDIADDLKKGIKDKWDGLAKGSPKPKATNWLDDMEDYFKKQREDFLKKGISEKFKQGEEYVGKLRTYVRDITVMLSSDDPCEKATLVEAYGKGLIDKFF